MAATKPVCPSSPTGEHHTFCPHVSWEAHTKFAEKLMEEAIEHLRMAYERAQEEKAIVDLRSILNTSNRAYGMVELLIQRRIPDEAPKLAPPPGAPYDVPCPECFSAINERCRVVRHIGLEQKPGEYTVNPHKARVAISEKLHHT